MALENELVKKKTFLGILIDMAGVGPSCPMVLL